MPGRQLVRLASARDALAIAQMACGWLLTARVPQHRLPALASAVARGALALAPWVTARGAADMRGRLGSHAPTQDFRALFAEHYRRRCEHVLGKVLDGHPRGWHPETELVGAEHLRAALGRGRGAVLWGMAFCGSVVPKMALWRAGFSIVHLSRASHGGFSQSWAARRVLNAWHLRSENKYLAERVVIPPDGAPGYLRTLKRRLADNRCVSIQGEHRGRRNIAAACLGAREEFATGAPHLAWSTGAALLTLHSRQTGPGGYTVVIDPPIDVASPGRRADAIASAVEQFAVRLERHILADAADWERWSVTDPVDR